MTPGAALLRESDSASEAGVLVRSDQDSDLFEPARYSGILLKDVSTTAEEIKEIYSAVWASTATAVSVPRHLKRRHEVPMGDPQLEAVVRASVMAQPGWLDGEGSATQGHVETRAVALLMTLVRNGLPRPRVFPTEEGGLQAEWSLGGRELSVSFETDGTLYALAVDVSSGESEDLLLDGDDSSAVFDLLLPGDR